MKRYFVYIVRCRDNSFYTGWTTDLDKRLLAHNAGIASKYTRVRRPVERVYSEELDSKVSAMRREYEIKTWSREKKIEFLRSHLLIEPH